MNRKKIIIFFSILLIIIAISGYFIIKNIKKNKEETLVQEYIPQEEIGESQARQTIVSLYFPDKEKQEIKPENNKHTEELENILKLKKQLQIRQKQKNSHSKTYYIKDIINRLENIEKEIIYSINKKENLNDNEVLKTIIFNIE